MFINDSVERIFRLGGENLLDAEDEVYVKKKTNLMIIWKIKIQQTDSRYSHNIIIQLWDILESAIL